MKSHCPAILTDLHLAEDAAECASAYLKYGTALFYRQEPAATCILLQYNNAATTLRTSKGLNSLLFCAATCAASNLNFSRITQRHGLVSTQSIFKGLCTPSSCCMLFSVANAAASVIVRACGAPAPRRGSPSILCSRPSRNIFRLYAEPSCAPMNLNSSFPQPALRISAQRDRNFLFQYVF